MAIKSRNRSVIYFLTLIILLALIYMVNKNARCPDIGCLMFPGREDWVSTETFEKTDKSWRGMVTTTEYKIKIYKVISPDQINAREFTNISLMKIKGLFDDARSPYPGAISDTISCQDKYKLYEERIISDSGLEISYFKGYMNDRLQYGACTDDQVKFVSEGGFIYCPEFNEWYQIEIIYSFGEEENTEKYKKMFKSMSCQRPSVNIGRLLP